MVLEIHTCLEFVQITMAGGFDGDRLAPRSAGGRSTGDGGHAVGEELIGR